MDFEYSEEEENETSLHPILKDENDSLKNRLSATSSTKAGVGNHERVKQVVYEMSKGSKYYKNEEKKDQKTNERIEKILEQYEQLKQKDLKMEQRMLDTQIKVLEAQRDLSKWILHLDMDAFFAQVEIQDEPHLADCPMAVGGSSMLCTANYKAREFGVRSAMPGFIAKELCPDLIIVRPNFEKYKKASEKVQLVLAEYDSNFEMMSLDEAYLDISLALKESDKPIEELTNEIRRKVFEKTGLTCSAGVAVNRMLAKVCTDINKPNGQFILPATVEAIKDFIQPLSIRKISGIGKVTEAILNHLEIKKIGDLNDKLIYLYKLFSPVQFNFLLRIALGLGHTLVGQEWKRKSISHETTFKATNKSNELVDKLREIAYALSNEMKEKNLKGKTLTLVLKSADFEKTSKATTLPFSINEADPMFDHALKLLESLFPLNLRLMGLKMSCLEDADSPNQTSITQFIASSSSANQEKKISVACPVCQNHVFAKEQKDLDKALNRHLDECLNQGAIEKYKNEDKHSKTTTAAAKVKSEKKKNFQKKKQEGNAQIMNSFLNKS